MKHLFVIQNENVLLLMLPTWELNILVVHIKWKQRKLKPSKYLASLVPSLEPGRVLLLLGSMIFLSFFHVLFSLHSFSSLLESNPFPFLLLSISSLFCDPLVPADLQAPERTLIAYISEKSFNHPISSPLEERMF